MNKNPDTSEEHQSKKRPNTTPNPHKIFKQITQNVNKSLQFKNYKKKRKKRAVEGYENNTLASLTLTSLLPAMIIVKDSIFLKTQKGESDLLS